MAASTKTLDQRIDALDEGGAFVDRSGFRFVEARGLDARRWLNDLVTAGIHRLRPGQSCRSLLLSPTGRIRADVQVLDLGERFLLVQDPSQPRAIDELLDPYVLSSAVDLAPVSATLLCCPGGAPLDDGRAPEGARCSAPSMLGAGFDLIAIRSIDSEPTVLDWGPQERFEVGEDVVEAWRIRKGLARFPLDVDEDSLPAEAGLVGSTVDLGKGCFLGQESVAKVRNLGHPPRAVVHREARGTVGVGDIVFAERADAGLVTSATSAPSGGGTSLLARVRWEARESGLVTESGLPLEPV